MQSIGFGESAVDCLAILPFSCCCLSSFPLIDFRLEQNSLRLEQNSPGRPALLPNALAVSRPYSLDPTRA